MIQPHASDKLLPLLVKGGLKDEALSLAQQCPKLRINQREYGDLQMLSCGGFTPLAGFMTHDDWMRVCSEMRLSNGVFWPIPITVSSATRYRAGQKIALWHPKHDVCVALLTVEDCYEPDKQYEAEQIYLTGEEAHPGVAVTMATHRYYLGGKVQVLEVGDLRRDAPLLCLNPEETRAQFATLGWKKVAAFQTRNPMHRSHEALVFKALCMVDGVMVHSLLGALKPGDVPAAVRTRAIDALIEQHLPHDKVFQAGYPLDMRYAGPREALLHALFRQNYGCTHFIIGRDHAGVGDYYQPMAAQQIFEELRPDDLQIKPILFDVHVWCHVCQDVVSVSECPHSNEHHLRISGTQLRHMLETGQSVPETFSRSAVLSVLQAYYMLKDEDL